MSDMDEGCDHDDRTQNLAPLLKDKTPVFLFSWLVVIKRDTNQPEVVGFSDYDEALKFYDRAGLQWTEVFLAKVTKGPRP